MVGPPVCGDVSEPVVSLEGGDVGGLVGGLVGEKVGKLVGGLVGPIEGGDVG